MTSTLLCVLMEMVWKGKQQSARCFLYTGHYRFYIGIFAANKIPFNKMSCGRETPNQSRSDGWFAIYLKVALPRFRSNSDQHCVFVTFVLAHVSSIIQMKTCSKENICVCWFGCNNGVCVLLKTLNRILIILELVRAAPASHRFEVRCEGIYSLQLYI